MAHMHLAACAFELPQPAQADGKRRTLAGAPLGGAGPRGLPGALLSGEAHSTPADPVLQDELGLA